MIYKKLFKVVLFLVVFTPLYPPSAFSAENSNSNKSFYGFIEAEILGGYSQINSVSDTASTMDSWTVSPNFKLNEKLQWLNVYYGSFDRSSQIASQEEGGRQTQMTMSHSLSTAFKYNANESWALRPLFFADWVFISETEDESIGNGLYDYEDLGGGIESSWTFVQNNDQLKEARLGFRVFSREYPNFTSLLTLFDPNGSQEDQEKDFTGYKISGIYNSFNRKDWSWGFESISLYKDFADKKTINFNGIRQGDTREDFLQYFNANISRSINGNWRARLDSQFAVNFSNMDFYDTRNTAGLGDDVFVKNYFDYYSFSIKPALIFTKSLDKERFLTAEFSYLFYALLYADRNAQDVAGNYLSKKERDYTHTLSAKMNYPLNQHIAWVSLVNYTIGDSNQDFERFYLYSYDLWNVLTGFSFKY